MDEKVLANRSVLIIDDEQATLEIVKKLLVTVGADASSVSEPKRALEVAAHGRFDVIILNRSMPGVEGYDLLQALKANEETKHIPVIMLSGEKHSSEVMKSIKMGAAGYVVKPFTPKSFLTQLNKILHPVNYQVDVPE